MNLHPTENTTELKENQNQHTDPITGERGVHPVATSILTGLGGVAGGTLAAVIAGGPVGIIAGVVVGAVSGGALGSALGEAAIPTDRAQTSIDDGVREYYASLSPSESSRHSMEAYKNAYRFGLSQRDQYDDASFGVIESTLTEKWEEEKEGSDLPWSEVRTAVRHAYSRPVSN